ncbi:MAG: RuBisCO large subunit C-terminal-like domain-containing protein [Candidatus Atabeyarchaeum deiterrae]
MIDEPAIHAHPNGPAAGARAFRQAIDAVMQGTKVSEYAEEHEELKTALTKWGTGKTGFQM